MGTLPEPPAVTRNVATESARLFLAQRPPFNRMEAAPLAWLAARLSLGYYPKGSIIAAPGHRIAAVLYVIQRGAVERDETERGSLAADGTSVLACGEIFPLVAVLRKRPPAATYTAAADTFCYLLPADDFAAVLERSARLRQFTLDHFAMLLEDAQRALAMESAGRAQVDQLLNRPLHDLVRREPVRCRPDTPIGTALELMSEGRVGSVLVVDHADRLLGILTRHDVLDRIALARRDLAEPVSEVMTPAPCRLGSQSATHEAATLIAREGFRHVPIVEGDRVIGVVTESDLFAMQHASLRSVRRTIAQATDVPALAAAAREVRELARRMFEHGVAAEPLTHIVTTLNDAVTSRAIEIERGRRRLPAIEWCWLAFGSEGRYEQTVSTDQDNGIIFDAEGPVAEPLRQQLGPFAQGVNRTLDACGFPSCQGGIMAGNPQWCLSFAEWESAFARWIEVPEPRELLSAAIFFDFRGLYGDEQLAVRLRRRLAVLIQARPLFLRQLAAFAIESRPPLGLLGSFVDDDPAFPATLDLKRSVARLFIDAARVFALAAGAEQTNTALRLRASGAALGLVDHEVRSAIDAFWFVQGLRLRGQFVAASSLPANRIALGSLTEIESRLLKECVRQARRLQVRLALDYRL